MLPAAAATAAAARGLKGWLATVTPDIVLVGVNWAPPLPLPRRWGRDEPLPPRVVEATRSVMDALEEPPLLESELSEEVEAYRRE